MDYIDWCEHVLSATATAHSQSGSLKAVGVDERRICNVLLGDERTALSQDFYGSDQRRAVLAAVRDLISLGLLNENRSRGFYSPTQLVTQLAGDLTPIWAETCAVKLTDEEEALLTTLAGLSEHPAQDFANVSPVSGAELAAELNAPGGVDEVWPAAKSLGELGLASFSGHMGGFNASASLRGLIWLRRRGASTDWMRIDALVAEWETTSVEFKRELRTGTADEKAELVKDLTALANTQSSSPHLLIVGFDPKTREYAQAPDPKLSQDHLEQIVAAYLEPFLIIRYRLVDYRHGPVGEILIEREPHKLPYIVRKAVGDKRRVEVGDVFVRHGSQVEHPTTAEMLAITDEGERARQRLASEH